MQLYNYNYRLTFSDDVILPQEKPNLVDPHRESSLDLQNESSKYFTVYQCFQFFGIFCPSDDSGFYLLRCGVLHSHTPKYS